MALEQIVIPILIGYPKLLAFIAGFLAEEILLALSFLSGQGLISFQSLIVFGFLGALCIESIYYFIATSKFFRNKIIKKIKLNKYKKVLDKIDKLAHHNVLLTLFLSKFFYGPRTIVVMNFAYKGMPYKKLMYQDVIALLLWMCLMLPIGWAAGQGLISSYDVIREVERAVAYSILFTIFAFLLGRYIINRISKRKR